ncbi:hypothetical protein [Limosilactobacillus caecicola]|uniref:hypothetical protein n=1 Tax=Limosilactobacillus caecicola TaxID=2941332 RepID=UPI00204045F9|nr:hypothetical protein [Limosilactobacillus caecicola]
MIKVINYALGSKTYFEDEIKDYTDRHFVMAENLTTEDNYILLDLSDKANIFGSSIKLETIYNVGIDDFKGYFFLQAFDLGKEKREMLKKVAPKVLDDSFEHYTGKMTGGYFSTRMDHPQTHVMLTVWKTKEDLEAWLNSKEYAELKDYTNQQLRNFTEIFKTVED